MPEVNVVSIKIEVVRQEYDYTFIEPIKPICIGSTHELEAVEYKKYTAPIDTFVVRGKRVRYALDERTRNLVELYTADLTRKHDEELLASAHRNMSLRLELGKCRRPWYIKLYRSIKWHR